MLKLKSLNRFNELIPVLIWTAIFTLPFLSRIIMVHNDPHNGSVQHIFYSFLALIQMPGITGLEFLRSLPHPPLVILVTAFQQHALDGFELDVVDYLVKPVPFARFLKAVQKAQNLFKLRQQIQQYPPEETEHVFVNANYSLVKIMIREIAFIDGLKDYVRINMTSGKTVITRLDLKAIEEKLDNVRFMRVHKSYIIALDKIDSVQKSQLVIQGREIPIGDGYRQLLQNYINSKNL